MLPDRDIVENCVIPEILFRMQHTWLESQSSYNLTNGSWVGVNSDVVFTTYQANANLQPACQKQIVDDVAKLPFVIRERFAAFQFYRKEVRPNIEHERQETDAAYIYWGVDANDLEFGSPSIFTEEEVTSNYPPGYGPPLGEDWPNSDGEQSEVLVPETPE